MENEIVEVIDMVRQLDEKMQAGTITNDQRTLLDGLNAKLDAQEQKNAEWTQQFQAQAERELEFKNRIEDLEEQLINNKSGLGIDYKKSPEYKALTEAIKWGFESTSLDPELKSLLRSDTENSGGFVVSTEMSNTILEPIIEMSPLRQYASVIQISSKSITMPRYLGTLECQWEGEAEQGMDTTASFGTQNYTPFRLTTTIPITKDMLMNASFDIETYIMTKANEAFALKESNSWTNGTGVKQPLGFLQKDSITSKSLTSESVGAVTADDVLILQGELKQGYNEMMCFNRKTLAYLRTLKGSDGHYLWQPALNGVVTNTIGGVPYFLNPSMPDIVANAFPIAIADFKRGYEIVDRVGLSIVRDELTQKRKAIVEITLHKYLTGGPAMDEAFKLLKVKKS